MNRLGRLRDSADSQELLVLLLSRVQRGREGGGGGEEENDQDGSQHVRLHHMLGSYSD